MKSPHGGPVRLCALMDNTHQRDTQCSWGSGSLLKVWSEAELEWWGGGRAKPERKVVVDLEGPWVQAGSWGFIPEEGDGALHKVC